MAEHEPSICASDGRGLLRVGRGEENSASSLLLPLRTRQPSAAQPVRLARKGMEGNEGTDGRRVLVELLFCCCFLFVYASKSGGERRSEEGGERERERTERDCFVAFLPSFRIACRVLSLSSAIGGEEEEEEELRGGGEPSFCCLASEEGGMATWLNNCYKFMYY